MTKLGRLVRIKVGLALENMYDSHLEKALDATDSNESEMMSTYGLGDEVWHKIASNASNYSSMFDNELYFYYHKKSLYTQILKLKIQKMFC